MLFMCSLLSRLVLLEYINIHCNLCSCRLGYFNCVYMFIVCLNISLSYSLVVRADKENEDSLQSSVFKGVLQIKYTNT